ncbi:DNA primase/helicase [Microbacterium phage Tinyman4]|nr:DNA primase/helicase [Microbacterium phage Tinyman4]
MDTDPLTLVRKVWRHAGVAGNVWMPHISKIGQPGERFREGAPIQARKPELPELRESVDWYWTPAVSRGTDRNIKQDGHTQYPAQRVIWVDCDESYNDELLLSLRPSYLWETSPGHKQAIWLMSEEIPLTEFHRNGFMGMLTQALGADKSGVDVSQLLRVPGTWHHKRKPFQGRILSTRGTVYTRGMILSRVAKGLGFGPALASELGADDPYGDRSKLLWKFARSAAELGLPQDLTFKLIKATKWNKWQDEPERLKEDIERAYEVQPSEKPEKDPEREQAADQLEQEIDEAIEAWSMATVDEFGPVIHKPISWILPGIIPEGGCGLIVAAPKVGKTRIAIEIALGLASGNKPLGISSQRPQPVGFFSLEDGEYLFAERLSAGMKGTRAKYHWDGHIRRDGKGLVWEPQQPLNLLTHFAPVDLSTPEDQQRLYETIERYGLRLVIIDTLSMAIGKTKVTDNSEMYEVLKPLKLIAQTTGCAVMLIHHTRKRVFEKGESIQESILGATALHGWSDFIMTLAAPSEETDLLRLGVQSKRGSDLHYISSALKIIPKPTIEEV